MDHFSLLKSIPRNKNRTLINLNSINLPFFGKDIWTLYELSWLNKNGLPEIAIGRIEVDANSINIIESKSLKLYLNSFNQIRFNNRIDFFKILNFDLRKCVNGKIFIKIFSLDEIKKQKISVLHGHCIDYQYIKLECYEYNQSFLINSSKKEVVSECLYSNLFKSNCPVTHLPDWASIQIIYTGRQISHSGLLSYLISFRNHNAFHEDCIERIFYDIENLCHPKKLSVYARYTRRGGIDINPWRSNTIFSPNLIRLVRQ